jgi:hypothetical protein
MIDVDPLVEALGDSLAYSADDHSAVMWVESSVEHHFPQANRDEVRILTAAVTEALLATGLVHVGGVEHLGMTDEQRLQRDRGDPLAAGLDHVLGASVMWNEPTRVDATNVAGAQPAVVELVRSRVLEVRVADPGTAHLDLNSPPHAAPSPSRRTMRSRTPTTMRPVVLRQSISSWRERRAAGWRRRRWGWSRHPPRLDDSPPVVLLEAAPSANAAAPNRRR